MNEERKRRHYCWSCGKELEYTRQENPKPIPGSFDNLDRWIPGGTCISCGYKQMFGNSKRKKEKQTVPNDLTSFFSK